MTARAGTRDEVGSEAERRGEAMRPVPRMLDLFAGIGGASIGAMRSGMEVAGHSEIEPFPCSVLEERFPGVPNLGDVSKWREWDWDRIGHVDVVSAGSPCQGMSVAGKRLGLADERSNLFYEAVGIVRRCGARYFVWENVAGAFSSARGHDFAAVLDALADAGALDIAWRVLDARFFGVPQRRRRIFLVADFGGERAGEILALSEGMPGNPPPGREAGEEAAGGVGGGVAGDSRGRAERLVPQGCGGQVAPTLDASFGNTLGLDNQHIDTGAGLFVISPVEAAGGGGEEAVAFNETGPGWWNEAPHCGTLRAEGENRPSRPSNLVMPDPAAHDENPSSNGEPECIDCRSGRGQGEHSGTLQSKGSGGNSLNYINPVAVPVCATGDETHALTASYRSSEDGGGRGNPILAGAMKVRRLTPVECEKLQGFPPAWTDVAHRGKPAADGPRYRALGNAWCVNVGEWVMARVKEAL